MSSTSSADRAGARPEVPSGARTKIIAALDGSRYSESALAHGASLARAFGAGLHLVTVLDALRTGATSRTSAEARLQRLEAAAGLERVVDRLCEQGHDCTFEVREGQPSAEILGAALEHGIGLIALAARPRGPDERLSSGSVLHGLVASGLPSLLVARGVRRSGLGATYAPEVSYRRIGVAVDGSRASHHAMRTALTLAESQGAEIVLVHVLGATAGPAIGRAARHGRTGGSAGREIGPRAWRRSAGRPLDEEPERRLLESGGGAATVAHGIRFGEASEAMRYLRVVERTVRDAGVPVRSRLFRSWADAEALEEEADLLVIAAVGDAGRERGYGSTARRLLMRGPVPVLAMREEEPVASSVGPPLNGPGWPAARPPRRTRERSRTRSDTPRG